MFPLQDTEQKQNRQTQKEREANTDGFEILCSCSGAYNMYVIVFRESFMQSHYVKCVHVTCGMESNEARNSTLSASFSSQDNWKSIK